MLARSAAKMLSEVLASLTLQTRKASTRLPAFAHRQTSTVPPPVMASRRKVRLSFPISAASSQHIRRTGACESRMCPTALRMRSFALPALLSLYMATVESRAAQVATYAPSPVQASACTWLCKQDGLLKLRMHSENDSLHSENDKSNLPIAPFRAASKVTMASAKTPSTHAVPRQDHDGRQRRRFKHVDLRSTNDHNTCG